MSKPKSLRAAWKHADTYAATTYRNADEALAAIRADQTILDNPYAMHALLSALERGAFRAGYDSGFDIAHSAHTEPQEHPES